MNQIKITSPSFKHMQRIPDKFTCKGNNINPELQFVNIPNNTKSLALIFDDPDCPTGTWDHWVVWNLPVKSKLLENEIPSGCIVGLNSWGKNNYGGPCPPSGTHKYHFKVYALNTLLNIKEKSNSNDLRNAMSKHIIGEGLLIGLYSKEQ